MRIACNELPLWFSKTATIVTPSPFLAGVAQEQLNRERQKQGLETWERPAIYGLNAWLEVCWREARYTFADVPSLLSAAQERALWHEIIEQEHPQLFDISATVRLAMAATRLLAEWHIPSEGELWNEHADAQQFQHWNRLLQTRCRENHWITQAHLERQLTAWMSEGRFRPQLTVFAGFEETSPALASLQSALGSLAVRLKLDPLVPPKRTSAKGFDNLASELDFAARRLRLLFEENSQRSLALFVPELSAQQSLVKRTLDSVFFPSLAARVGGETTRAKEALFHLSGSGLLCDEPIIAAALLLLNLAAPQIDHADAGAILRSPFIAGAAEEKHQRALADVDLRRRRELDVQLSDIEKASRRCPILVSCWQRLRKLLPKFSGKRSLAEWSELVSDLLQAMGWPGERVLTAREERVVERWQAQLSTLASLGLVTQTVSCERALVHLRRLLAAPVEHGDSSSPIQVLDSTEAGALSFDAALICGLSEETWPPPVRTSPLVPFKLQRQYGVPGSTSTSVREMRTKVTKALFAAAPDVLATFTETPSILAASHLAINNRKIEIWDKPLAVKSFVHDELEQRVDGQAPAFVASGVVRGGTGIIKAQSHCPFRAFAEYRLNARSPEDASFGFDARERGGFVHKALENVWKRLQSQAKLRATSQDDLRELVREAIAEAVNEKEEAGPLHQLSVLTERERLETVILEWLALEALRKEPFTVETMEEDRKYEIPGLSLKLRVDRIDRLNNGNLVLIDYKSGAQTRPKLAGERPQEPQLLVYAASVESQVDGLFFGQLKPRDVKAVGYSRKKQFGGQTAQDRADWDEYLAASRDNVEKLAQGFVRGVAEVDPIKGACDYCGNKPFCRVNDRGVSLEDEE